MLCRLLFDVDGVLNTQTCPNPGVEHVPIPLHGLPPHLELSHLYQRPAGVNAPQPPSGMDAALCILAEPSPQALHRAGSTSVLPQESKGKPLPTHHQDISIATEEMNHPNIHEYTL